MPSASPCCLYTVHLDQLRRDENVLGAPPARPASTHPPPRGTPCTCSSGAGAGRFPPPRTPCTRSSVAGAGRCSPPRTPCTRSFGAGAGRCPLPRTPCIGSSRAGAGRCSPPRTPCIGSSRGCAGRHCLSSARLPLLRQRLLASAACQCPCQPASALRARRAPRRRRDYRLLIPLPLSRWLPR